MTKVFIHVGPHKTGSTYLQKQLRTNAEVLASHGVTYPDLRSPLFGHGRLARRLRGWGPAVTRAELSALMDREALVLSSENLVLLSPSQLGTFADLLDGASVTVVFVLRSLTKVLPSHWQETIKHGNTQTFPDYLAKINGWIDGSYDQVIPSRQLEKFAQVFGTDALAIISYEHSEDLFQTFGEIVLGDRSPAFAGDRAVVNQSFAPPRVELVRQLNLRFRAAHGRTPGQHLRVAYMQQCGQFERSGDFQVFAEEFGESAVVVRLADDDPFIRDEARAVDERFGHRIVNRPAGLLGEGGRRQTSETRCSLAGLPCSSDVTKSIDELYRSLEPLALELLT
jgi:hypothetical protein